MGTTMVWASLLYLAFMGFAILNPYTARTWKRSGAWLRALLVLLLVLWPILNTLRLINTLREWANDE